MVPAVRVALLVVAIAGVLVRPRRLPVCSVPVAAVVVALAVASVHVSGARHALHPLYAPLAFLLLAVPLAVLLDQLGFFAAIAARIDESCHLHLWLWVFAAAVTTLFNLDASVVLLTPLYVRIAHRHGLDPLATAFPPVLLASLASSALPVSNLTNLLAAERFDLGVADFLFRLGPASLAATTIGYLAYRRTVPLLAGTAGAARPAVVALVPAARDPRPLHVGVPIVLFVLVGFTVGDQLGVPAWVVAGSADAALLLFVRRVPWRDLPVLVPPRWPLPSACSGRTLGAVGVAAAGANAVNNLPALLVAMPALGPHPGARIWAVLLGVNIGPVLIISGSLAGLLWFDTIHRLGIRVSPREYTRMGIRVGLPALAAAAGMLLLTNTVAR